MAEKTPWDILDEVYKDQINQKIKLKFPPNLLETKYFDEMGYKELELLCKKYIDLFNNNKVKFFDVDELLRLAILIGNRCSIQAEAEHDAKNKMMYYENMRKVSELGLSFNPNKEELLWNLGVAYYFQGNFEDAVYPFSNLLRIEIKARDKEKKITEDKVISSTPYTYLKSIYKELNKISENKKILKEVKELFEQYKEKN
jgi:tetratricopeptide (TPR) repeat protein